MDIIITSTRFNHKHGVWQPPLHHDAKLMLPRSNHATLNTQDNKEINQRFMQKASFLKLRYMQAFGLHSFPCL